MTKWLALTLVLVAAGCSDPANTQYLPIGSPCSSDRQCGTSPYDCAVAGYPGGYCEKSCATDGDCPSDSLCSALVKACRRVCTSDAACRTTDWLQLPAGRRRSQRVRGDALDGRRLAVGLT